MINLDAAALIATVYPIGILVIAVEARATSGRPASSRSERILRVLLGVVQVVTLVGAIGSTAACVNAVVLGNPLEGFTAWLVIASGVGLELVASFVLLWLVYEKVGLIGWVENAAKRAARRSK
jgi:hypothetical protein